MTPTKISTLAIVLILVSSCSSPAPRPAPKFEDNFTEIQLAPNIFKIVFTGDIAQFLRTEPQKKKSFVGRLVTELGNAERRRRGLETSSEKQDRELVETEGMQTVIDYTLLRSAEVTLENGFKYFVVVNSETWDRATTTTTPAEATTKIKRQGVLLRRDEVKTTVTQGETRTTIKPSASNTILCYTEKPEGMEIVYDAALVSNSIRKSYNITD